MPLTEAEIEKKYRKLQAETDDELEQTKLETEKHKEIGQIFRDAARASQSEALRREAINKYPLAILAEVDGETPEELEESAKTSHEKVKALVELNSADMTKQLEAAKQEIAEAKAGGWKGNTAGGGGGPTPTQEEEKFAFLDGAWKSLRDGTLTQQQRDRLIKSRVDDTVAETMARVAEGRSR